MLTKDADATAGALVDAPAPGGTTAPVRKPSRRIPAATSQPSQIYIDGKFWPETEAKISVFDHGLLYGDGIFEGIRFYQDRVFRLEEHIDRLWDSAKAITLDIPMSRAALIEATLETIRQNDL